MTEQIEVQLMGLVLDPVSKMPVMLLKPEKLEKIIPIWIGISEANNITIELENITSPRPMTHDLLNSVIRKFDYIVDKVIINEIQDNTYYAELHIGNGSDSKVLDCRPSDAVAIALKTKAKIYQELSYDYKEKTVLILMLKNVDILDELNFKIN